MKQHSHELWTILPCAALLVAFGAGILLRPHADFSETENRPLTDHISFDLSALQGGALATELSAFYTDQFPLRLWFTAAKARTERLSLKQENNGILFGKDGTLFPRTEVTDLSTAQRNLEAFAVFRTHTEAQGIPVSLLVVPRSADVMTDRLPTLYQPAYDSTLLTHTLATEPTALLPLETLRQIEAPYYRTDHHWTTEGAYVAYAELLQDWQLSPYPPEFFQRETADTSFYGSSYATSGGVTQTADTVTLYRYEGDDRFTVTDRQTGTVRQGFYDRTAPEREKGYEIFLGGNFGQLHIAEPNNSKHRLLLVKDSFANAMIPFLALHFDLTVVDLRYDRSSLSALLEKEAFDRVLVLQGADTLATDPSLCRLLY